MIEAGESPLEAMRREFDEEAGARVDQWRKFAVLTLPFGVVHFFAACGFRMLESRTAERVAWYNVDQLAQLPTLPNTHWLALLALDKDATTVATADLS